MNRNPLHTPRLLRLRIAALLLLGLAGPPGWGASIGDTPDILLVTVDTLRVDRVSAYGYERPTTPNIDALLERGVRFDQARTVEPLTTPALASMLTSRYPHVHGATRNGLRMRSGLASLPKALQAHGYRTAAFVSNWTLRDKLSGMAEHFEDYQEVLTRKRWFGLVRSEAGARDINAESTAWIAEHRKSRGTQPYLVWVHYTEPHAPYRLHEEFSDRLGIPGNPGPAERYDTEVAFVDAAIGRLLEKVEALSPDRETLIVFASDHGESLGEHDYWGHGRNLFEPTLRVPMAIAWPGHVKPQIVAAPALNIDLAPTILGLLRRDSPSDFAGYDWTAVLEGRPAPLERITRYEAHRGAVVSKHESELARRSGLLAVGLIRDTEKEIFRIDKSRRSVYDLAVDPGEMHHLGDESSEPTEGLLSWMRAVYDGLRSFQDSPPQPLDEESVRQLRSLGYVD